MRKVAYVDILLELVKKKFVSTFSTELKASPFGVSFTFDKKFASLLKKVRNSATPRTYRCSLKTRPMKEKPKQKRQEVFIRPRRANSWLPPLTKHERPRKKRRKPREDVKKKRKLLGRKKSSTVLAANRAVPYRRALTVLTSSCLTTKDPVAQED